MSYKKGDAVTYIPMHDDAQYQKGIVKKDQDNDEYVFVVYHCGNDWGHFEDYTAARTHIKYLTKGWINE